MSPDKHVEAVRQKLLDRSVVGLKKYGCTTETPSVDHVGWLNHLQLELLDAANYIEAAMATFSDIDTLEQENRFMRARMERLEREAEEHREAVEVLQSQLDFLSGVRDKNIVLAAKLREAEDALAKAQQ